MSPLRPWYCAYDIRENGRVELRLVWSETPTVSHSRDYVFSNLDEVPPALRDAVSSHRATHGTSSGTFDFAEGWATTELDSLVAVLEPAAPPSRRRRHSTAS